MKRIREWLAEKLLGKSDLPVVLMCLAAAAAIFAMRLCGLPPAPATKLEQIEQTKASGAKRSAETKVRRIREHTVQRPDGALEQTRDVEESSRAGALEVLELEAGSSTKLEERPAPRPTWRVAGDVGWQVDRLELRPSIYGLEVSRRVVGPWWVGAWARTDKTSGVSLAVEW